MIPSWIQSETDGEKKTDELLSAIVYYIYYEKEDYGIMKCEV